jgi:hypothetical protein
MVLHLHLHSILKELESFGHLPWDLYGGMK